MLRTINTATGLLSLDRDQFVAWLTSETAIILYIFVILSLIAILVVSIVLSESKDNDETEIHVIGDLESDSDKLKADDSLIGKERFCMLSAIDGKKGNLRTSEIR